MRASCSSIPQFTFLRLCVSLAEMKHRRHLARRPPRGSARSPARSAPARCRPTSGKTGSVAASSSASASCGIHFGETKEVTSIRRRPASARRVTSSRLLAVGTVVGLVLEPVAGSDLVDEHVGRGARHLLPVVVEAAPALAAQPARLDPLLDLEAGRVARVAVLAVAGSSRIAWTTSSPTRSASASGPIGWLQPPFMHSSMPFGVGDALAASAKAASLIIGKSTRFTTKPGAVLHLDRQLAERLGEARARAPRVSLGGAQARSPPRPASSPAPG